MNTKGLILALALVATSAVAFVYVGLLGVIPLFFLGHATDRNCDCHDEEEE
jgi:hypothetical protein